MTLSFTHRSPAFLAYTEFISHISTQYATYREYVQELTATARIKKKLGYTLVVELPRVDVPLPVVGVPVDVDNEDLASLVLETICATAH
ncbi:MAG TPA: hypothetical protein VJH33_01915 [Candidatus Paceibacterota bacterium]